MSRRRRVENRESWLTDTVFQELSTIVSQSPRSSRKLRKENRTKRCVYTTIIAIEQSGTRYISNIRETFHNYRTIWKFGCSLLSNYARLSFHVSWNSDEPLEPTTLGYGISNDGSNYDLFWVRKVTVLLRIN